MTLTALINLDEKEQQNLLKEANKSKQEMEQGMTFKDIRKYYQKNMKINKLRIKMGKDLKENSDRIEIVRMLVDDDFDLRIDVNGAWNREHAFAHIPLIKKYKAKVVEQRFPQILDPLGRDALQISFDDDAPFGFEIAGFLEQVPQIVPFTPNPIRRGKIDLGHVRFGFQKRVLGAIV